MTSEPRNLLNPFEILAIVSVCGVLFMAAHRECAECCSWRPTVRLALLCGPSPQ